MLIKKTKQCGAFLYFGSECVFIVLFLSVGGDIDVRCRVLLLHLFWLLMTLNHVVKIMTKFYSWDNDSLHYLPPHDPMYVLYIQYVNVVCCKYSSILFVERCLMECKFLKHDVLSNARLHSFTTVIHGSSFFFIINIINIMLHMCVRKRVRGLHR